ncbi:nitroreductase family protein [Pontibacter anaerobius]|uniref:Nitroreductase family protein n=1 Tax=Pontibacter anaerobius TaxID=2993940 RepID=A0ABT3RJY0_9BACT|nr:nitroreductase family protein [Pontibacter anaerobius]MCX2741688.1 nitroreductase family protein [Pontibacter anaerobius]
MTTVTENSIATHTLIENRWSPRAFTNDPVSEEQLEALFEAARWAPSAMNEQPWRFIYATKEDKEVFEKLGSLLVEGNNWAKNAGALFVSIAKTKYDFNGSPNKHAWHDVGLATGNLLLQATELGLHVHLMGGFDAAMAKQELGIPDGFEAVAMGAVGYAGDPESLPEPLKARELAPRKRKPLRELVFKGQWEQK